MFTGRLANELKRQKLIGLCSLALLLVNTSFAANYPRKNYNWRENQTVTTNLTDEELNGDAVIIEDDRYFDYTPSDVPQKLELYVTHHFLVHINNDKGIERYNKVSTQLNDGDELIKFKARVITQNGKVLQTDLDKVKLLQNYETYGAIKEVAIEGVERGCDVEYIYTVQKGYGNNSWWGNSFVYSTEVYQTTVRVKNALYEIHYPKYLVIDTKAYGGFPTPKFDYDEEDFFTQRATIKEIPALVEEKYANAQANRMKIAYNLAYNKNNADQKIVSWASLGYMFYKMMDRDEVFFKLETGMALDSLTTEGKIIAIEDYIKTNIKENHDRDLEQAMFEPKSILKTKIGAPVGILRLYAKLFKQEGIKFYLVLTSNRYQSYFDKDFIDFANYTDWMFYFPDYNKFVAPEFFDNRFGPAPYLLASNYSLVMKTEETGNFLFLPVQDANKNKYRMDITTDLSDFSKPIQIHTVQLWNGYMSYAYRGQYAKIDASKYENYLGYLAVQDQLVKILDQKVENIAMHYSTTDEPLKLVTDYQSGSLIELAGKDFLVNIGQLIGKQDNLYQPKAQVNDIEMEYPKQYVRYIKIKIPKGYHFQNLKDLNIDKALVDKGNKVCDFTSSYEVSGDMLVVAIREYYRTVFIPKERFEEFKSVINAAADFNNLQLILAKD